MNKIIFILVLFCSLSFAQGWNSTVMTSINEPNLEKMDVAANASGIHVLIRRTNGNIVYYFLNSSGVMNANKTYTMDADGDFPNIVASNNIVYALYKTASNIKGKYSTNGGINWINLTNINTTANLCNGVDAVYEESISGGVHLVWATRDNHPNFETYYYRLRPSDYQWVEFKNVTDHSLAQSGGRPSISYSPGRVHVSFNTSNYEQPWIPGSAGNRDRLNGVWQIPQPDITGSEETVKEKLLVRENTLFMFYAKWVNVSGLIRNDLLYRTRSLSGTTWSSPTILAYAIEESGNAFSVTKTIDNKIHIVIYPEEADQSQGLVHRSYNGSSWSSAVLLDNDPSFGRNIGLTSVSNDLFLTFMRSSDNYLRYKQNNQSPLTPSGLAITKSGRSHPYLQWNANAEPDLHQYIIEKYVGELGWISIAQTTNRYYEDMTESYCTAVPPALCEGGHWVYYRLKAVDVQSLMSNPSGSVGTYVQGDIPYKISGEGVNQEKPDEYSLAQNYPNPFNPSTTIKFSIKENSYVTLRIYNILGKEVAFLVNERKEPGNYSVAFNGDNLPSGVYVYRLDANDFTATRKLMIAK